MMKIGILLGLAAGFSWAQIPQDQWRALVEGGDPAALVDVIEAQGPDFRLDAAMLQTLCDRPALLQAALDYLYDGRAPAREDRIAGDSSQPSVAPPAVVTQSPPPMAPTAAVDVEATLAQKIVELVNTHRTAGTLGNPAEAEVRRIEAREFLTQLLSQPRNIVTLASVRARAGSDDFLPDWARAMIERAAAARDAGFPTLKFSVSQNLTFFQPSREDGVRGSFGLFLVKRAPDSKSDDYDLSEELLGGHEAFPVEYDAEADDIQLTRLEHSSRNLLNLKKILNGTPALDLLPGVWCARFRHATGRGRQLSDRSFFFEVEAGKAYEMDIALERQKNGLKDMAFTIREVASR